MEVEMALISSKEFLNLISKSTQVPKLLHRLCNQISSSTHSSVVQGHVEVQWSPLG